jgi:hypothetical protein
MADFLMKKGLQNTFNFIHAFTKKTLATFVSKSLFNDSKTIQDTKCENNYLTIVQRRESNPRFRNSCAGHSRTTSGVDVLTQFSAIFANFRRKNWRFSQKQI